MFNLAHDSLADSLDLLACLDAVLCRLNLQASHLVADLALLAAGCDGLAELCVEKFDAMRYLSGWAGM